MSSRSASIDSELAGFSRRRRGTSPSVAVPVFDPPPELGSHEPPAVVSLTPSAGPRLLGEVLAHQLAAPLACTSPNECTHYADEVVLGPKSPAGNVLRPLNLQVGGLEARRRGIPNTKVTGYHTRVRQAQQRAVTLTDFATVPEDWLGLMPTLLRQLTLSGPSPQQRDALLKLQKMALCTRADAPVWSTHFEHVLEAVLRSLQHPDDKLRERGMACTKDLLRAQPQRFRAFTEHVLLRLLAAGRDSSREVAAAAEEALELLLSVSDAHRCMAVLVPVVMKEGPPTLQLAVRMQSKLVARFSQLQLISILPQVLQDPLYSACGVPPPLLP